MCFEALINLFHHFHPKFEKKFPHAAKEGIWPDLKPLKKIRVKKYRLEKDKLRDRDKDVFSKSKKKENLRRNLETCLNQKGLWCHGKGMLMNYMYYMSMNLTIFSPQTSLRNNNIKDKSLWNVKSVQFELVLNIGNPFLQKITNNRKDILINTLMH